MKTETLKQIRSLIREIYLEQTNGQNKFRTRVIKNKKKEASKKACRNFKFE